MYICIGIVLVFGMMSITGTNHINHNIDDIINDISDLLPHINNITALSDLVSPDSLDVYVMDNIRYCNNMFSEVTEFDNDTLKTDALRLLPIVESLGYMMSLPLLPGDSRSLSVKDITLTIQKITVLENLDTIINLKDGDVHLSLASKNYVDQDEIVVVIIKYDNIANLPATLDTLSTLYSVALFGGNYDNRLDISEGEELDIAFSGMTTSLEKFKPECQIIVQDGNPFSDYFQAGCRTHIHSSSDVVCSCNIYGSFFVQLSPVELVSQNELGVITWIGCAFNAFICGLVMMLFIGFRLMKEVISYLRLSFLLVQCFAEITIITGVSYTNLPGICILVSFSLYFCILGCHIWLFCYVLYLASNLQCLTNTQEAYFQGPAYFSLIGWGMPLVVTIVALLCNHDYFLQGKECSISTDHGINWILKGPQIAATFFTGILLLYMIIKYTRIKVPQKKQTLIATWRSTLCCVVLCPLLGVTWVIGVHTISHPSTTFQAVFFVLNILLGIVIFLCMFYCNQEPAIMTATFLMDMPLEYHPEALDDQMQNARKAKSKSKGSRYRKNRRSKATDNAEEKKRVILNSNPTKAMAIWSTHSIDPAADQGNLNEAYDYQDQDSVLPEDEWSISSKESQSLDQENEVPEDANMESDIGKTMVVPFPGEQLLAGMKDKAQKERKPSMASVSASSEGKQETPL